jgi:hypothetical protein
VLPRRAEQRLYPAESAEVQPRRIWLTDSRVARQSRRQTQSARDQYARPRWEAAIHPLRNVRRTDRGVRVDRSAHSARAHTRDDRAEIRDDRARRCTRMTPKNSDCPAAECAGSCRRTP